jgi:hypothetical protein
MAPNSTATSNAFPCPNHLVHQHTFPELAIGTGSNQQSYFRAMVFFNKKPGLTDEFFHEHWKSVHADLTMQVEGAGVDLVRYVQVSTITSGDAGDRQGDWLIAKG